MELMEMIAQGNMANTLANLKEIDTLRAERDALADLLERMANGSIMSGTWTHIECVERYQAMASAALATRVTSSPKVVTSSPTQLEENRTKEWEERKGKERGLGVGRGLGVKRDVCVRE
jgi:hypothetical protein